MTVLDSRELVGTFIAFDKHLNLVLSETEEIKTIKAKKVGEQDRIMKRPLGLVLLRGENVVAMSAEAPPAQAARKIGEGAPPGPGKA